MFKFEKSRSKITVMVTYLKSMAPLERSGHKGIHAKYERPISCSKKVIANVPKKIKGHGLGHKFKLFGTIGKA